MPLIIRRAVAGRRRRHRRVQPPCWPRRREGKTLDPAVLAAGVAAGLADPDEGPLLRRRGGRQRRSAS